MLESDWLMRTIRQLIEALARVVGIAKAGQVDDAKRELDELYTRQLGLPRRMIDRLDANTALMTLGREKAQLLLMLLEAELEVHKAAGDERAALLVAARASELRKLLPEPTGRRSRPPLGH